MLVIFYHKHYLLKRVRILLFVFYFKINVNDKKKIINTICFSISFKIFIKFGHV